MSNLIESFSDVKDPRIDRTRDHPLVNIITIAICGVICGADSWVEIESFGKAKRAWLSGFLDLTNGIPSHDTFGRVFSAIDAEEFQNGFSRWIASIQSKIAGDIVSIDGKALRRSHDNVIGRDAIYMVSAWSKANRFVLGQRKVDEKSNEITAIPLLLEVLALSGCIVTIDAMGCQRDITEKIVDQNADYVLSLKGNQGQLNDDTNAMFDYFKKIDFKEIEYDYKRTVSKGHGRLEIRHCWCFDPTTWQEHFRTLEKWPSIKSLALVMCERHSNGKVTKEERTFISSLQPNASQILDAVRSHWGIENELHWVLDIAFREDESRIRKGNSAENMSVLRHIALNLLKQEQTTKMGIHGKRLKCGWDEAYLEKVLQIQSI